MQLTNEHLCVIGKTFCFGFILTVDTVNHRLDLMIRMFAIAKLGLRIRASPILHFKTFKAYCTLS